MNCPVRRRRTESVQNRRRISVTLTTIQGAKDRVMKKNLTALIYLSAGLFYLKGWRGEGGDRYLKG